MKPFLLLLFTKNALLGYNQRYAGKCMKVPAENKIINEPPLKAQYGRPNVDKVSTENIFRTITPR